jgi:hypothetical protein
VLNIEDSFAKLQFEANQKLAEIKALATQQQASAQRLDDALKHEAEAQVALKKTNAALDQANKELSQARRDAAKIKSDLATERDLIRAERQELEQTKEDLHTVLTNAATLIKSKENE